MKSDIRPEDAQTAASESPATHAPRKSWAARVTAEGGRAWSQFWRALAAYLFVMGALVVVTSTPSEAAPAPRAEPLTAASCSSDCNRKASECLDECEEKFKDDDKARVTCKFECATKRQECDKSCG